MSKNSSFWEKVYKCEHTNRSNYMGGGVCSTPYCGLYEYHCLDCGVYISEYGCGSNSGLDGWSWKRRMTHERKKYGN